MKLAGHPATEAKHMNNWLNRLERKYGRYGIPNLTNILVAGQILVLAIELFVDRTISFWLGLSRSLLLQGQGAHTGPAGAPAVQVHCCLFCRGSPQAQVCPGGGILHPQRAVVFRLAGKGFALKQRLPFSRCSWLHSNSSFHLTIV